MMRFFFFKQKTAYEMRISDWSSDVCSSDLMRTPIAYALAWPDRMPAPTPRLDLAGLASLSFEAPDPARRSEERRVGKECVRPCRSRWSPYQYKKKKKKHNTD